MASRLAAAAMLAALLGCNDYRFSPAGHCLIQPGQVSVTLDDVSTVDFLFVVDDSPSMDPKQLGLATSFESFVTSIVETNTQRASRGLLPIDFHIAVTTSSIAEVTPGSGYCVQAAGGQACCQMSACAPVTSCTRGTATGCGTGQSCVTEPLTDSQDTVTGEAFQCCTSSACESSTGCALGDQCPSAQTGFPSPFQAKCTPGLATAGAPYASGALVSFGTNPTVLDFPKTLDWASWGTATQDPNLTTLVSQFEQNVKVGSCGSGEEQHLEAARLALQKATAANLGWPHPGAKLIIVWVGDEDDCSSPTSAPLVMASFIKGADSCVFDKHRAAADQREYPISEYASYFPTLVHTGGASSLAAAFIVSSVLCADGTYAPADVCEGGAPNTCPVLPPASCNPVAPACDGDYASAERFFAFADLLKASGTQVVEGTVCDAYPPATFGPTLAQIANLAKPPSVITLPSEPAAQVVSTVVIEDTTGKTTKVCTQGPDWCFVACGDTSPTPTCLSSGVSQCLSINPNGGCQANPGETYSAEYVGLVPSGGCTDNVVCANALGGTASDWTCTKDVGQSIGTCTCTTSP